jgi:pre-rRNA-processing protein TSR4
MFQARVALAPEQVLRYCYQQGAQPLWPKPRPTPAAADIPACPHCGTPRRFEMQARGRRRSRLRCAALTPAPSRFCWLPADGLCPGEG